MFNFFINTLETLCREFLVIYVSNMVYSIISSGQFQSLFFAFAITSGVNLSMNILNIFSKLSDYSLYPKLEKELRSELFAHSHNLSLSFIFKHGEGYLESILDAIADGIMDTLKYILESILPSFLLLFSFLIYIGYVNLTLGLVHVVWMIVYAFVFIFLYKKTLSISKEFNGIRSHRSAIMIDIFKNMKIIRIFNLSRLLSARMNLVFSKETNTYGKYLISDCKNTFWVSILYTILEVFSYFLLYKALIYKTIPISKVLLILSISGSITDSLNDLLEKFVDVYESMGQASQSYNQLLAIKSINNEGIQLEGPIVSIQIHNLSYSINNKVIFSNLNLLLKKGDKLIIVGESGVGKSTLLSILLKFIEVPDNTVFINNIDINRYNIFSIYKAISYLGQNNELFNASILDNLKFANPLASKEQITKALTMAHVQSLEKKLNTLTGSGGAHLSGGEAKRLSMARIFMKNMGSDIKSSLFIGDEPTSALDRPNQKRMLKIMEQGQNIVICTDHSGIFPPHPQTTKVLFLRPGGIGLISSHKKLLALEDYQSFFS